jgi:hypothetical protein
MAWRNPDMLQAYEHYFDDMRHADTQDQLYSKWYEDDLRYEQTCVEASPETNSTPSSSSALAKEQDTEVIKSENGWGTLLMLGGPAHA